MPTPTTANVDLGVSSPAIALVNNDLATHATLNTNVGGLDNDDIVLRPLTPDETRFATDLKQIVRSRAQTRLHLRADTSTPTLLGLGSTVGLATNALQATNINAKSTLELNTLGTSNVGLGANVNPHVHATVRTNLRPNVNLNVGTQLSPSLLGVGSVADLTSTNVNLRANVNPLQRSTVHLSTGVNPRVHLSLPVTAQANLDTGTPLSFLDVGGATNLQSNIGLTVPLHTRVSANANLDSLIPSSTASVTVQPSVRLNLPAQSTSITANAAVGAESANVVNVVSTTPTTETGGHFEISSLSGTNAVHVIAEPAVLTTSSVSVVPAG